MSHWKLFLLVGFVLNVILLIREIYDLAGPQAGSVKERISWSAIAIVFTFVPWIYPVLWCVEAYLERDRDSEP